MRHGFFAWVLATALTLVGLSASAQPTQNAGSPAALTTLPAAPPTSLAALRAAGEILNLSSWRPSADQVDNAARLMEEAASARRHHRFGDDTHHGRARRGAVGLYWEAYVLIQDPGVLDEYARAMIAGGNTVGCAILDHLAQFHGGDPASRAMLCPAGSPTWPTQETSPDAHPVVTPPTQVDTDHDGVIDPDDLCVNEAQGARPDPARRGCALPTPVAVVPHPIVPPPATFHLVRRSIVHTVGPWATMGAGAVLLGAGVWRGLDANSTAEIIRLGSTNGLPPGIRSENENAATHAMVLFIAGGVLVAGGIVWEVLAPPATRRVEDHPVTLRPSAWLDNRSAGVVLGGTF